MRVDQKLEKFCTIEEVNSFNVPLNHKMISLNLTWTSHIDGICSKARKRLSALRILKRSGAPPKDLITVYCAFKRPVPQYLADGIDSVQRRGLLWIAVPII